jgi:hypothetical protein
MLLDIRRVLSIVYDDTCFHYDTTSSLCCHYALSSSKWTTISVFQYHVKSAKIWLIEHFARSYISCFKVIHLAIVQCGERADRVLNVILTLLVTIEYLLLKHIYA